MSLRLFARRLVLKHWLLTGLIAAGFGGCNSNAPAPNAPGAGGSTPAAPTTGQLKRIILLTNGDDPFWDTCFQGMQQAETELKLAEAGFKVVIDKPDFTENMQISMLKQYASQTDVAAVAISPVNAFNKAIAEAMEALRAKGIPVICLDSDMSKELHSSRTCYLGTNNLVAGGELGKCAKGLLPSGSYATFVGKTDVQNAIERIGGFAKGAGEGFVSKDSLGDDADRARAQQNVKTVLDNHPDVNCLVGIWAYNAHQIVQVVQDRGIRDKTKIVVFDAAADALADMDKGLIDAMIVQNPFQMGYEGTKIMKALVEVDGATLKSIYPGYDPATGKFAGDGGDVFTTELRVVVPDDKSPLKPEMFDSNTKFFYIQDFRKWLAERKLRNS